MLYCPEKEILFQKRRNPFQKGTDSEKFGTPIKKVLDYRMKI